MKILITGSSGFLGTWLGKQAVKDGHVLYGIDLRTPLQPQLWKNFSTASMDTVDFDQLLEGCKIDAVFHLAGGASVSSSVNNPYGDFSSLLPGTARLALYLIKAQPQARLFLFSSAAVYGNPIVSPITENTPIEPISPYGIHKATAESLLSHYSRIYDLKVTFFRIFSVYGPELRKQLIWDVSQRALTAVNNKDKKITLFGTGAESRDFIYIKDLCRAVLTVMLHPNHDKVEIFNIASGVESTIKEVAYCLIHHLKTDVDIKFDGFVRKGDPTNWLADITKLKNFGFKPEYTIDKGIEQVAAWAKAIN